jgi:hypothetical protein
MVPGAVSRDIRGRGLKFGDPAKRGTDEKRDYDYENPSCITRYRKVVKEQESKFGVDLP